jgi:hypothetical protein
MLNPAKFEKRRGIKGKSNMAIVSSGDISIQ